MDCLPYHSDKALACNRSVYPVVETCCLDHPVHRWSDLGQPRSSLLLRCGWHRSDDDRPRISSSDMQHTPVCKLRNLGEPIHDPMNRTDHGMTKARTLNGPCYPRHEVPVTVPKRNRVLRWLEDHRPTDRRDVSSVSLSLPTTTTKIHYERCGAKSGDFVHELGIKLLKSLFVSIDRVSIKRCLSHEKTRSTKDRAKQKNQSVGDYVNTSCSKRRARVQQKMLGSIFHRIVFLNSWQIVFNPFLSEIESIQLFSWGFGGKSPVNRRWIQAGFRYRWR